MRSFHDWMECQQYYSHLKNLIKIKESPSKIIATSKKAKQMRKSICMHKRPFSISSLSRTRSNYPLFGKNQSKQQSICKENIYIAERLMNASSVISMHDQLSSYRKFHSVIKNNPSRGKQEKFKQKKLNKFMRIRQNKCIKGLHQYVISIQFLAIPRVPDNPNNLFWFQLLLEHQKVKSTYLDCNQVILQEIHFPIKTKPKDSQCSLIVHCYRGLQHLNLGRYNIQVPGEDSCIRLARLSTEDSRKAIDVRIRMLKIKKKVLEKCLR